MPADLELTPPGAQPPAPPRPEQQHPDQQHAQLPRPDREFVRFARHQRALHASMIVSFICLATTGLTLKFSYTGWAAVMSRLFGGFQTAGYIHRIAAVLMFGVFSTHLYSLYQLRKREHRSWLSLIFGPDSMMFNRQDLNQFIATMKWFVGKGPRPQYGRWTYWEKFDYFAVFWGIAVIGSTGLTLWFPVFFTRFLPGSFINIATIIHSDEALLATGFIFTVHFFNTHLRPEKFPMDTTIFTGHMPLAELKRDKLLEYEALVTSGQLEAHLEEPQPEIVVRTIRAFAWIALSIGFSVVVWIIYAMLFAYR
ncbi:MAG: cytochrome b/b6 domain-containing protein [Terriglobales bacterium]